MVEVTGPERKAREQFVFAHSPIRVGRSPLNDLPLEYPFVSHCHGLFHVERHRVEFVDVGSTNGTFVNGTRLAINQRVELSDRAIVSIGTLRLHVRLRRGESGAFAGELDAQRGTQLCERFARSFLELRRGRRQLLSALGLPAPKGDPLQGLDTPQALLAYLLDPAAQSDRSDELSRAHADMMMHEVALVSAIAAGARDLLEELAPKNLAPRGVGGVVTWLARLFGHDERWATLERKLDELHEDSTLSAVVLGRGFLRAYSAALGKNHEAGRELMRGAFPGSSQDRDADEERS
jgi:predicted component of type VI protein secretion system